MAWIKRTLTPHDVTAPKGTLQLNWIAQKYGTSASEIAKQNGMPWSRGSAAVNAWILAHGGKKLSSGGHVFVVGNKLVLPAVAVIPDPSEQQVPGKAPMASAVDEGGVPWWGWLGLIGGGIWAIKRWRKKPKKGTTTATIHRF